MQILTKLSRRYYRMSKVNQEAIDIAKYISSFLCDYAPSQLTNSENTLHSYETALGLV